MKKVVCVCEWGRGGVGRYSHGWLSEEVVLYGRVSIRAGSRMDGITLDG